MAEGPHGSTGSGGDEHGPQRHSAQHAHASWSPSTFRKALSLLLLGALLPGTAQIRAGRRRKVLGWVALTAWVTVLLGALAVTGYVLVTRNVAALASVAVRPRALHWLRIAGVAVSAGWLLLLLDAWWLSRPRRWTALQGTFATGTALVLAVAGIVPVAVISQYAGIQRNLVDDVFRPAPEEHSFTSKQRKERPDGRINVLLLGGDGGKNRKGVRTDSMQVASVDRRTGKSVLVALPRSLQHAPFPAGSPGAEQFPTGFRAYDGLLGSVYVYGEANSDRFQGAGNPGAEAIMEAASEITGLPIDYYVLANLRGFQDIVQAIGGIDIDVTERVPIGGRMGLHGVVITQPDDWIEPGYQHLDGFKTLWFARGRFGTDDYARMRRQRCVISAILDQAHPGTVLRNYGAIAASTKNLVETNIPQTVLPELVEIALDARRHKVVNVTFTNKVINTVNPDFAKMRRIVRDAVAKSTAEPAPGRPLTSAPSTPKPTATATPAPTDVTADLDAVCGRSAGTPAASR